MGYTTDFSGEFEVKPKLLTIHQEYLTAFSQTRRVKRNAELTGKLPDALREAVLLPVGTDGGYYVGSPENMGQDRTPDILDYNEPPKGQPGLWCQWVPDEEGTALIWDDGEKFYMYVEWIEYLIDNFLKPWGYKVSGDVRWQGEDSEDMGMIRVRNNIVKELHAKITYR